MLNKIKSPRKFKERKACYRFEIKIDLYVLENDKYLTKSTGMGVETIMNGYQKIMSGDETMNAFIWLIQKVHWKY